MRKPSEEAVSYVQVTAQPPLTEERVRQIVQEIAQQELAKWSSKQQIHYPEVRTSTVTNGKRHA